MVTGCVQRIGYQTIIALILSRYVALHRIQRRHGCGVEEDNSGHGVGAVHQRGRAFQDFDGVDAGAIHLDTVLVAPLLAFLADAIGHNHHPVIAQAADNRFGNGAAGGNLAYARLPGDGADDVGGSTRLQIDGLNDRDGRRYFFQMDLARETCDYHGIQL